MMSDIGTGGGGGWESMAVGCGQLTRGRVRIYHLFGHRALSLRNLVTFASQKHTNVFSIESTKILHDNLIVQMQHHEFLEMHSKQEKERIPARRLYATDK